jgi:uncharacterized protein (DUF1501 family)
MSTFSRIARTADAPTRRAFVAGAAKTCFGLGAAPLLLQNVAAAAHSSPAATAAIANGTARNVIYLFLRGGLSQIDTFDPKPGTQNQGPVRAIPTNVDGLMLGEYFPHLARQMDKVAIVASLTSTQGAHAQAQYFVRTGYELRGTIQHASLGAWVNRVGGKINPTMPGHVIVGGAAGLPSAGYFPPQYWALPIGDPASGLTNSARAPGVDEATFQRRLDRLRRMNDTFAKQHPQQQVKAYTDMYAEAVRLMRSEDLVAFDLEQEPPEIRAAYGDDRFGQGCLLARRLVEHGVRFVEVVSDGWDTHVQNFDALEEKTPAIDRGLAALLADLDARGLLHETLVVLATEFGRTPEIQRDNNGRNHFPQAFSALLAGGGIRGGIRYGRTDERGMTIVEGRTTVQDFNATIAHAVGLPLDHVEHAASGRPFTVADKGRPVTALFA